MPIIVTCPSCAGQLRVADDLIGRKVRCPACSTTFEAQSPPAAPSAPNRPAESEKVDAWKFLNLELNDDPSPVPNPAPVPLPTPSAHYESGKRAEREREESIPIPSTPLDSPRESDEPRDNGKARLNNDHDDLFNCPACGRSNHYGERRCYHCGERFRDEDGDDRRQRPLRRRRPERRDTEPHRGGFILGMGITSLVLLLFCAPLSIIPGLIGWICGQGDMRKMRENSMDDDGEGTTQAGWICSIIGTILGFLVLLGCGTIWGLVIYNDVERSRNFNRPPVQRVMPDPPRPIPGQRF